MKTIYLLKVRPSVKIPTGGLRLDVGDERTFFFPSLEERQKALDWCRANDWPVSTNIEHLLTGDRAVTEIKQDIQFICDYFHHVVPELKEA